MSGVDEARAVEHVYAALSRRFPSIAPAMVKSVVDRVYADFDGRVRDYVPLLVERAARDRLQELVSGGDARDEVGSGPNVGG